MMTRSRAKKRGFAGLLEIAAAAFILLGPAVFFGSGWGLYALFIAVSLCLGARLAEAGEIHITFNTVLGVLLGVYALLAFIFAESTAGHIRFTVTVFTAVEAMLLAADYFTLEKEKGIGGRLLTMIVLSADVCALTSIARWGFAGHFSLARPFTGGLGQSDLLGIFMFAGLWCAAKEFFEAKGKKKYILILALPLIFALIMSRSAPAFFFGFAFAALYLLKKRRRALSLLFAAAALSAGFFLLRGAAGLVYVPFTDAFLAGLRQPAGLGGGGFIARQTQLQSVFYQPVNKLGTGAELTSALGIFGLAAALCFIGRQLWLTFKYKSWFAAFAALLGIYAFFAPMGSSPAGLVMLLCVCVYSEWRLGKATVIKLKKPAVMGVCAALGIACLLCLSPFLGELFRARGLKLLMSDERTAAARFSAAAAVNPFDAESCRDAAAAFRYLYEADEKKEDAVNAEYYIKLAIERGEHSAAYRREYSRLLADTGDYASAAAQDELAVSLAPLWDEYKVALSENLYKQLKSYERGSVEAQRCYARILECAEAVSDLEKKKTINDFADKAQPYTRLEFFEGGPAQEDAE